MLIPARLLYLEPGKRLDDVAYNATEPKLADTRSVVYLVGPGGVGMGAGAGLKGVSRQLARGGIGRNSKHAGTCACLGACVVVDPIAYGNRRRKD